MFAQLLFCCIHCLYLPNSIQYLNSYLGNYGVAVGFERFFAPSGVTDSASVGKSHHPSGKPIIHSVMAGCKRNFAPVSNPVSILKRLNIFCRYSPFELPCDLSLNPDIGVGSMTMWSFRSPRQ